jgi:gliding motility-associated lipoprotein GldH
MFLTFTACVPTSYYEGQQEIASGGWSVADTVFFSVDIQDTIAPMDFLLNLRHTTDYPFSNLYLFVETVYPDRNFSRDTLEIMLAGKDGKWFGKGFGKLKEVQVMLKDRVVFPASGTYRFGFVQGMREEVLLGIEDLGIQIRKSQITTDK